MISCPRTSISLFRQPLFRLLAINLAVGVTAAALMLGGLLALNPHGLRDLIVADRSPLVASGLLLFGLIVTFGSVAMGTAIMAIGRADDRGGKPKSDPLLVHIGAGPICRFNCLAKTRYGRVAGRLSVARHHEVEVRAQRASKGDGPER